MIHEQTLTILNALGESVFILDSERRILFANPSAVSRFGRHPEGSDFVVAIRHPDCLQVIAEVLEGANQARSEVTLDSPLPASYEVSATALGPLARGEPSVAVCLNDISNIRQAEQMRSDFVANVSHELRSPLTTLSGLIETLQGPARDDAQARQRFLDLMQGEATRMTRLISDLLSLSRVEARARIRPATLADIPAIAGKIINGLAIAAEAERKTIRLQSDPDLPPVPGDEDELGQLLNNLIENAVKYGAPGTEVTVRIFLREGVAGFAGPAVAAEIRDRGEGIAPENVPRLTERFYRVDKGRSRDKGGTGLGLAIVKHIVKRHRGRLVIESQPGVGSTFTVFLPTKIEPA